jgi:ribosomal protein S27E
MYVNIKCEDCGKIERRYSNAKVCLDCSTIRRNAARKASKDRQKIRQLNK